MLAWTKNILTEYTGKCPHRFGFIASAKQTIFCTVVENPIKSIICKKKLNDPLFAAIF